MANSFPIVKVDRTTAQEFLPILMNRGIFSNYHSLPMKSEILERKKQELGVDKLTAVQERDALCQVGQYKTGKYVVKDYGDYAIGFSAKMYIDFLEETEAEIRDEFLKDNYTNARIEAALQEIKLYKLAHKIAMIILSEAYKQRKYDELVIPKQLMMEYLGYTSADKHIYHDIKEAMFSLRWLNYVVYEFQRKVKVKQKSKMTGNFIYNLREDNKSYTVWINKVFLGCIEQILIGKKENRKFDERKKLFERGYYDYPTRLLPMSRHYTTPAYLLLNFVILDSGNNKLKQDGLKVVAYKIEKYIKEAQILYSRADHSIKALIKALEEIEIFDKIEPSLDELKRMRPALAMKQILYIYMKDSAEAMDQQMKSVLLVIK